MVITVIIHLAICEGKLTEVANSVDSNAKLSYHPLLKERIIGKDLQVEEQSRQYN